jgi:GntR family transcriptional regulator, transcriptional repressor for pyruvate dehydrogenase complex
MVDTLPKIGGRERHAEQIYWAMVDWLSEADVQPGDRIPGEVELADQFSVSRPTMREAIRVLEYSGLVQSRRGRNGGLFVGTGAIPQVIGALRTLFIFGDKSRSALREAREIIESGVARLAASRITDEQLTSLASSIDQMATDQSVESVKTSNDAFHLTIADACGNDFLRAMMIALNSLLNEMVHHSPGEYETFSLKVTGHRQVYDALSQRDAEASYEAMRDHIRTMARHAEKMDQRQHIISSADAIHVATAGE